MRRSKRESIYRACIRSTEVLQVQSSFTLIIVVIVIAENVKEAEKLYTVKR